MPKMDGISYVIDELYSMTDEEIQKLFVGCVNPDDVVKNYTIPNIEKLLETRSLQSKEISNNSIENPISLNRELRTAEELTEEDVEKYGNTRLEGRILWYDSTKRKGIIIMYDGQNFKKIYISVSRTSPTHRKRIFAGVDVNFRLEFWHGHAYAYRVNVLTRGNRRKYIEITDDITLDIGRRIRRYGMQDGLRDFAYASEIPISEVVKSLKEKGYDNKCMRYVYIRTPEMEYRFYKKGSPLQGDGQVDDLFELLEMLDRTIMRIDVERKSTFFLDPESKKEMKRQQGLERAVKNQEAANVYNGFIELVESEIVKRGHSTKVAKAWIRSAKIEKKLKCGDISINNDPLQIAAICIKSSKRVVKDDLSKLAYLMKVRGYIRMKLKCPKHVAKDLIKNSDYNDMLYKEYDVDPKMLADEICQLYFDQEVNNADEKRTEVCSSSLCT